MHQNQGERGCKSEGVGREREEERSREERKERESKIQRGGKGSGKKRRYQGREREQEGLPRDGWRERKQTWSVTECV